MRVTIVDGSTYSQICVFHAIVEAKSIRGASQKLGTTPSSVSKSLKALESHFNLLLFSRHAQKLQLTDEGFELYQLTKDAVVDFDRMVESLKDKTSVAMGKIKITLPRFAYQIFVIHLLEKFNTQYPQIELELVISDVAVDIVKEGIEIGIRFGDRINDCMVAKRITPDFEEAIFASSNYLEKFGIPITLDDLKTHKLINYRFSSQKLAPFLINDNGNQIEVEMQNSIVVNDTDAVVDCAKNGLGIGRMICPRVKNEINSGKLIPVLEAYWPSYPGLFLYFPQNIQKTKRVRAVIDFLTDNAVQSWANYPNRL